MSGFTPAPIVLGIIHASYVYMLDFSVIAPRLLVEHWCSRTGQGDEMRTHREPSLAATKRPLRRLHSSSLAGAGPSA